MKKNKLSKKKSVSESQDSSPQSSTEGAPISLGRVSVENMKKKKEEEASRRRGRRLPGFKAPQGKRYLWALPPTSPRMNGFHYVEVINHNDLGPEGDGWCPCVRTDMKKETRGKCPACVASGKLWNKARELKAAGKAERAKETEELAKKTGPKVSTLLQIVDLTAAYDKEGKLKRKIPSCFGENTGNDDDSLKYDKCEECAFKSSCQKGVQTWKAPFSAHTFMEAKLVEDNIDFTNPGAILALKVGRTGEGMTNTKYTFEWASEKLKAPDSLIKYVERTAIDLTTEVRPATPEQVQTVMDGGKFQAGGGDGEDSGEKTSSSEKGDKPAKKKFKDKVVKPRVSEEEKEEMIARLKKKMGALPGPSKKIKKKS